MIIVIIIIMAVASIDSNLIIQRIEAFWSQLRKSVTDWWIQFFKDFQRDGHFNSTTFYHMYENSDPNVIIFYY
jgi:hypothetical protein